MSQQDSPFTACKPEKVGEPEVTYICAVFDRRFPATKRSYEERVKAAAEEKG